MDTLTLIILDTNTHSDTNDIICYMIIFWELNSYWGNFKIFLHGEWNEKIWIVCHVWNCLDSEIVKLFGQFALYKNLHILFLWIKWWNLDHYCRFWEKRFLHILFMWANLDHYCLGEQIFLCGQICWTDFFYVYKFVE